MVLLTKGEYGIIYLPHELAISEVFFCVLLILSCIRFYHGSMKSFIIEQQVHEEGHSGGKWLFIDFVVLSVQTIVFSIMSFYIAHMFYYMLLFLIIVKISIIWGSVKYLYLTKKVIKYHPDDMKQNPTIYKQWVLNNLFICGILVIALIDDSYGLLLYFSLSVNVLIGYGLCWHHYILDSKQSRSKINKKN